MTDLLLFDVLVFSILAPLLLLAQLLLQRCDLVVKRFSLRLQLNLQVLRGNVASSNHGNVIFEGTNTCAQDFSSPVSQNEETRLSSVAGSALP